MISRKVYFSNGIGTSPDGATVYQADTFRREVHAYDLDGAGAVRLHRTLSTTASPGYPDGLAVDVDGCLWVAMFEGGCVARFDPQGRLISRLPVPARQVTSVCFSGAERSTLAIVTCDSIHDATARGCVYEADLDVRGLPANVTAI